MNLLLKYSFTLPMFIITYICPLDSGHVPSRAASFVLSSPACVYAPISDISKRFSLKSEIRSVVSVAVRSVFGTLSPRSVLDQQWRASYSNAVVQCWMTVYMYYCRNSGRSSERLDSARKHQSAVKWSGLRIVWFSWAFPGSFNWPGSGESVNSVKYLTKAQYKQQ